MKIFVDAAPLYFYAIKKIEIYGDKVIIDKKRLVNFQLGYFCSYFCLNDEIEIADDKYCTTGRNGFILKEYQTGEKILEFRYGIMEII